MAVDLDESELHLDHVRTGREENVRVIDEELLEALGRLVHRFDLAGERRVPRADHGGLDPRVTRVASPVALRVERIRLRHSSLFALETAPSAQISAEFRRIATADAVAPEALRERQVIPSRGSVDQYLDVRRRDPLALLDRDGRPDDDVQIFVEAVSRVGSALVGHDAGGLVQRPNDDPRMADLEAVRVEHAADGVDDLVVVLLDPQHDPDEVDDVPLSHLKESRAPALLRVRLHPRDHAPPRLVSLSQPQTSQRSDALIKRIRRGAIPERHFPFRPREQLALRPMPDRRPARLVADGPAAFAASIFARHPAMTAETHDRGDLFGPRDERGLSHDRLSRFDVSRRHQVTAHARGVTHLRDKFRSCHVSHVCHRFFENAYSSLRI